MRADRKAITALVRAAEAQGWRVVPRTDGVTLCPPDRTIPGITLHFTASDHRALKNARAALKRAGLKLPR